MSKEEIVERLERVLEIFDRMDGELMGDKNEIEEQELVKVSSSLGE